MTKTRTAIPTAMKLDVLKRNKHRCCICYQEQVTLHHIDKDTGNNNRDNLAVLCLHHHGLAHAHFELAQNLTQDVIRSYKKGWEHHIAQHIPLPTAIADPMAMNIFRQYERQQAALRIVLAEELLMDYRMALERYRGAGGHRAGLSSHMANIMPCLRTSRWDTLTELGHLQEYAELLAKTYAAITQYNLNLTSPIAGRLASRDWADWNLRVGTAIAMSLSPLLVSLDRPAVNIRQDFKDWKFLQEFPQE